MKLKPRPASSSQLILDGLVNFLRALTSSAPVALAIERFLSKKTNRASNPAPRGPSLAGGGGAGAETVGAVNDFLREGMKFYHRLTEDMLRVVLVHPGEEILPELGKGSVVMRRKNSRRVALRSVSGRRSRASMARR